MKKLLLILLCLPMIFSCGEKNTDKDEGHLYKVIYDDGSKYVGEYKDEKKMHGQGTYTWANGDKYVGGWKDNKKYGQGTLTYTDGTVKEGLWKNDKFLGE
jgi:hypothetical protein